MRPLPLFLIATTVIVLIATGIWLHYNPKTASWRNVRVAGHTEYYPVIETDRVHMESHYICDQYAWRCFKGRDGTTICKQPRPDLQWQ